MDHLGTPQEITSWEGKVVWSGKYQAYGNLALKQVEEVENNIRFQGQYYDQETGLHYNRHRYYDPSVGQFISQDPIGLLGGENNYQYAPNPIKWIDPLGLSSKESYGDSYESIPIKPDYIGENDPNNALRWNAPEVCKYYDSDTLAACELDVINNKLVAFSFSSIPNQVGLTLTPLQLKKVNCLK